MENTHQSGTLVSAIIMNISKFLYQCITTRHTLEVIVYQTRVNKPKANSGLAKLSTRRGGGGGGEIHIHIEYCPKVKGTFKKSVYADEVPPTFLIEETRNHFSI